MLILRKKMKLNSSVAMFLFVANDVMVPSSSLISELYSKHHDLDSYLYVTYCSENTFG